MAVADFAQGVTDSRYWFAHLDSMKPKTQSAATASTDTASTNSGKPLITTGADGKSFFENVLDIVNPLEHLPVVSTIYHAITGNQSGDLEKVAGDTLYGGVIGLASSVANLVFEKITGKDFGDTMLAMVGLGDDSDQTTRMASAKPADNDAETAQTAWLNKASLDKSAASQIAVAGTPLMPTPAAKLAQALNATSLVAAVPAAPAQMVATASATAASETAASATAQTANAATQSPVDISPDTDALLQSLQRNGVTGAMQTQALDAYRRTMTMNSQQSMAIH